MRFVPPVAALAPTTVTFDGDEQARSRPIAPCSTRCAASAPTSTATRLRSRSAVRVGGAAGRVTIDASGSSQFVSGLLLSAAAFDDGLTTCTPASRCPSTPHVDMTVEMLRDAGVDVDDTRGQQVAGLPRHRRGPAPGHRTRPVERDAVPGRRRGHRRQPCGPRLAAGQRNPATPSGTILKNVGAVVRHGDSYLEVQGPPSRRGIDIDLHDVGELTPRSRRWPHWRRRVRVAPARHRAPARPRDRPAGRTFRRDQRARRAVRPRRRRPADHRATAARRAVALLRRPPDGDRRRDRRAAGRRRRGRGHRHHRQDAARFPEAVGRHAGRAI